MARKTRKSEPVANAPEATHRLTAPVGEALYRKSGAFAKAHGITLGALVSAALEAHMRHWYVVDRSIAREPRDGPGCQDVIAIAPQAPGELGAA